MALVNAPVNVNVPINLSTVAQTGVAIATGVFNSNSPTIASVENEALVQQANQAFDLHQFGIV